MPRFKEYDYNQTKLVPISFADQIVPGTFEYTLNYLVDEELDLSIFDHRYANDETGRPAYDPAILLKVVLYAYSRGITSSRKIEKCCRENVVFMALSADSRPHFTTIADFISHMHEEIESLFLHILMVCDEMNLIGKDMFAIDGCKMPSNASKEWSGTRAELKTKRKKIERAIRRILEKHRDDDDHDDEDAIKGNEKKQIETLRRVSRKIKQHLDTREEKLGHRDTPIKGNITDHDSAKMKTSHGVIQGYNGVVAVDGKHQVIVCAEAFGVPQEHGLLLPMVEGIRRAFKRIGKDEAIFDRAKLTADSGFHTERNMKALAEQGVDAYVADNRFRSRDPRFVDAKRFRAFKRTPRKQKAYFTPEDFNFDAKAQTCICPAGKPMWRRYANAAIRGYEATCFQGYRKHCFGCALKARCLRSPNPTEGRQVAFFSGRNLKPQSFTSRMKEKIDSRLGRHLYSRRIGTVEPVFGNLGSNLGLNRFSLRGKKKVNGQWLMYCLIHNMLKIHRYGPTLA